ncbi:ribosomal protein S21e [Trichuris suis]|nr:ribosomal protein S21e [Trichuris suis]
MQNVQEEYTDMYIPRKCSSSNRIVSAKDHASVQIEFVKVDPDSGHMIDGTERMTICGQIRRMGESDDSVKRLAIQRGISIEQQID